MPAGSKGSRRSAPGTPPPATKTPELRVLPGLGGSSFRAVMSLGRMEEIDVTGALTAPLAHALWQLRGGEDIANWVDAERLLDELLSRATGTPIAGVDVKVPARRVVSAG
jgi:hypothetical protein